MTGAARKAADDLSRDDEPAALSPEDEARFDEMEAESEQDERDGRSMTWEQFLAGRATRRAR